MRALPIAFICALTAHSEPGIVIVHDEPAPMQSLAQVLKQQHGCEALLIDQSDWKQSHVSEAQAVVMYVHRPIEPQVEHDLIAFVRNGGRLVVLHHGFASAKVKNPEWLKLAGLQILPRNHSTWPWRVLRGKYQLVNLRPDHYITSHRVRYSNRVQYTPSDTPSADQLLPALEFPDTEIFLNQLFTDGREKTVLFGFKTEIEGETYMQDRAGWLKTVGRGYMFYFQPGHFPQDFTPAYVQILANAIEWKPE